MNFFNFPDPPRLREATAEQGPNSSLNQGGGWNLVILLNLTISLLNNLPNLAI